MSEADKKIAHVFRDSTGSIIVTLTSNRVDVPPLQLKTAGRVIGSLERLTLGECGRYFGYYCDEAGWVFVLDPAAYPELSERVFLAASFNGWTDAIGQPEWELLMDNRVGAGRYTLSVPVDKIPEDSEAQFKFVTLSGEWLDVPANVLNRLQVGEGMVNFGLNPQQTGQHVFRLRLPTDYQPLGNERLVWNEGGCEEDYDLSNLQTLLSAATDLPLGAMVANGRTTFRLFAPRANEVQLVYSYQADASDAKTVAMKCRDGLTWEVVLPKDLSGVFYTYRVLGENRDGTTNFDASFAILDPYAKACLGNYGPGIVVDPKRLKKVKKPFNPPPLEDLVILEGHVQDLVARAPLDLTADERAGFDGLRKWVLAEGSYLRELGVNAIELQPIQQIGDVVNTGYHWGYMTANYFSPAGNYALEPESASQVEEFRDMVQAFHEAGMAVIIDVVYNHIGEPYHLSYIDTYYFLTLDEDNERTNWSGCGNDFRCDTPMARRLIIDSLTHMINVYDVDGFRFDLAELIGVDVLREVEAELKKVKPSLILIAEPWSFRGRIQNELKETGYASWNDGFRESMASYVRGEGNQDMIRYYLAGSPGSSRFAAQTINYTESHDDYCWIDRITERPGHDGSESDLAGSGAAHT